MLTQKRLNVLLVNAPVLEVYEPWFDEPDFGRVGLAYLAGYLRKYAEFPVNIKIIDAKFERLGFDEVLSRIHAFRPDIVGLTAFTNEVKPCAYLAHKIKEVFPDTLTLIGGAHVTAIPEATMLEFTSFDIGVIGEGELTFLELCRNIYTKLPLHPVNGLIFRQGEKLVTTAPRERILDQDSIPIPAWDLLPPAKTYFIQTERGCPFNCVFCMNHNGKVARKRSVGSVIEEIEMLIEKFHAKHISFGDELFSVDMKRTEELLDAMIAHDLAAKIGWDAQTHVRFVNYDLFVKMKRAGITKMDMGVETGDEVGLKNMGKGTSIAMIEKAFKEARKAGVRTGSFLLFGQPNETIETIQRTINLAVKINADLPMFGLMTPYPGTEVAKLAAKGEGGYRLVSLDWDHYRKQIGKGLEFANLSRRQIEFYQVWGYVKVFLWNWRIMDFLRFFWEYRKGAWSLFKNTFLQISGAHGTSNKPTDYEAVLSKGKQFVIADFIKSTDDWKKYQRDEQLRANKVLPSHVVVQ